jgi:DNA repair exonuclease SbcCD ATPase subunit
MNVTFKQIEVRNLRSFSNETTTFSFETGLDLITGDNGNGKSTIFIYGIIYALYGEGVEKEKLGELVNRTNKKGLLVKLSLSVDGVDYLIERGIKPDKFNIYIDGSKSAMDSVSVKEDNLFILNTILQGLAKKSFMRLFVIEANATNDSIFTMKANERRELLQTLFNLDHYSDMQKKAKQNIDMLKVTKLEVDAVIKTTKTNIHELTLEQSHYKDKIKAELKDLENREILLRKELIDTAPIDKENQEKNDYMILLAGKKANIVNKYEAAIKYFNDQSALKLKQEKRIVDIKKSIAERMEKESVSIKGEANREQSKKIKQLETQLHREVENLAINERKLLEQRAVYDEESKQMGDFLIACDEITNKEELEGGLSQYYTSVEGKKSTFIRKTKEETEKRKGEATLKIETETITIQKEMESAIQKATNKAKADGEALLKEATEGDAIVLPPLVDHDKFKEIMAKFTVEEEKTKKVLLFNATLLKKQEPLKMEHTRLVSRIDTINKMKPVDSTPVIKRNQDELKVAEKRSLDAEKEMSREVEVFEFLKSEKIKFFIMKQSYPIIKKYYNEILNLLFHGSVKVDINDQFNIDIKINGESASYFTLSQGERKRINLAFVFAIHKFLSTKNQTNMNILIMDELLDSALDGSGVESVMEYLNEVTLNKNVILITHRNENLECNRSFKFMKRHQFSSIDQIQ